jgi:two-component system, chemotaxis family, sensor kinase CheA
VSISRAAELAEILNRAALETVQVRPSHPESAAALARTLDELGRVLEGGPHAAPIHSARQALLAEPSEVSQTTLAVVSAAIDQISQAIVDDATPLPAPDTSAPAGRDAETIELFADFIAEGEEGLGRVDEILLGAEKVELEDEQVNELFRVFHTIKGVAAFLDAADVSRLSHATETLLDGARAHKVELTGPVLETVFEASTLMRELFQRVREGVERDHGILAYEALPAVLARIAQVEHGPKAQGRREHAEATSARSSTVAPDPKRAEPDALGEHRPVELPAQARSTAESAARPEVALAPRERDASDRAPGARLRETVKVDLERVDSVVEMIGELIIVESMVVNAPEIAGLSSLKLRDYLGQLTKISRDLQGVAMRMRMIPVRGVFQKMARLTRDLSRKTGKLVELAQVGEGTEMDRSMVERIEDPLVHMIRNAMDHAIETPDERRAAGKSEVGTLRLSAQHEGGSIAIEISDDGRGLRRDAILAKARQRGLVGENAEQLSDEDVFALIFQPGFSTAEQVSELSGRGVGMDVVKRSIEGMRGRIVTRSSAGVGTTFKLVLPLTLAIIDGMLVACGGETYVIPSLAIVESLQVSSGMVRTLAHRGELLEVRGEILTLVRLRRLCGVPGPEPTPEQSGVVIVESAGRKIALLVDEVVTQQQIVIKPLSAGLGDTDILVGAAILSDGRVGLILNVDRLGESPVGLRTRHSDMAEANP